MAITISGSGITSANIADGTIVNADINSSAAIDGTKVDGSFGKVLQVLSVNKTNTFTTTSDSFVDVTDLSLTITPSSTGSRVMIYFNTGLGNATSTANSHIRVTRGGVAVNIGDANSSSTRASIETSPHGYWSSPASLQYVDSPSTTSATTYKIQVRTQSGHTAVMGRSGEDTGNEAQARVSTNFTLMEIGA